MKLFPRTSCVAALAIMAGSASAETIGYYQFEDLPGIDQDSSGAGRHLTFGTVNNTQVASPFGAVPNPGSGAVANTDALDLELSGSSSGMIAADPEPYSDLTVEAYINVESVDSASVARVIASQFGVAGLRTFNFGIAGNGSGVFTQDRTLFLQLSADGSNLFNIDSTFRITLGNNYYVAASIDSGSQNGGADGAVTFYFSDLTAGTGLQLAVVPVAGLGGLFNSTASVAIGSSNGGTSSFFDGILDEVRLSNVALTQPQLLIAVPETSSVVLCSMAAGLLGFRRRRE